jgi:hypothetical protein
MPVAVHLLFEVETCIECGCLFGVTEEFQKQLKRSHRNFYCPNGHGQHYPEKTDAELEREKNARLTHQLDQLKAGNASLQAELAKAAKREKRSKRRAAAGVCPCCHRTFKQLAAHMTDVHPEFVETDI